MTLVKWQPNQIVNYWEKEVEDLFNEFFNTSDWGSTLQPQADLIETKDAYKLEIELPGVDKNDVTIELDKTILTVKGEKKNEKKEGADDYYQTERSYGTFSRQFSLPGAIKADAIAAEFSNGLLQVIVPKAEEAKLKTIKIN